MAVEQGEVRSARLQGQAIEARKTEGQALATFAPAGADLVSVLQQHNVEGTALPPAQPSLLATLFWSLLPFLLISSSPFDLSGVSATGRAGSDSVTRAGAGRSSLIQRRYGGARPLDRRRAALL